MQLNRTFSLILVASALACSESNFSGSGSNGGSKDASGSEEGCGLGLTCGADENDTPSSCVDGDFVSFKYRPEIQACIDDGKMWHFGSKTCTKMKKASFECNFSAFVDQMKQRNMQPTDKMQQGIDGKGLIVGCGESDDGGTILLQWFMTESKNVDCNSEAPTGSVISGCYGKDGAKLDGLSQEEVDAVVTECMNKNAG